MTPIVAHWLAFEGSAQERPADVLSRWIPEITPTTLRSNLPQGGHDIVQQNHFPPQAERYLRLPGARIP
jgi:hypothetical protein